MYSRNWTVLLNVCFAYSGGTRQLGMPIRQLGALLNKDSTFFASRLSVMKAVGFGRKSTSGLKIRPEHNRPVTSQHSKIAAKGSIQAITKQGGRLATPQKNSLKLASSNVFIATNGRDSTASKNDSRRRRARRESRVPCSSVTRSELSAFAIAFRISSWGALIVARSPENLMATSGASTNWRSQICLAPSTAAAPKRAQAYLGPTRYCRAVAFEIMEVSMPHKVRQTSSPNKYSAAIWAA